MIYLYIFTMAAVTYLIRMLPLVFIRKKIENKFIRSFLYYVPYACLMAMTFPSILYSVDNTFAALAGVIVAVGLAVLDQSLVVVALFSCLTVFFVGML